ncbi:MAG: lipoprotein signal peptidase [Muribaculaceae bacterium]|jgi:signal peptidase II|nr:lipoprotein signal peptidase [Muribaculaceae bacterium]
MKISNGKLAALIIALVIVIDQAVKIWVKTHFYIHEEVQVTSWFRLLFVENNGMAFGMELGSKLLLTLFRIVASIAFIYYLWRLRNRSDIPRGYVVCIALITAGALGNVIDCIAYGLIFNAPAPPQVAQMFPPDGGYGTLFNGRVVDMFYFPLCEWNWPQWMPWIGGDHFVFFQPVFNVADAALSVSVILLILFYARYLADGKTGDDNEAKTAEKPETDETPQE